MQRGSSCGKGRVWLAGPWALISITAWAASCAQTQGREGCLCGEGQGGHVRRAGSRVPPARRHRQVLRVRLSSPSTSVPCLLNILKKKPSDRVNFPGVTADAQWGPDPTPRTRPQNFPSPVHRGPPPVCAHPGSKEPRSLRGGGGAPWRSQLGTHKAGAPGGSAHEASDS